TLRDFFSPSPRFYTLPALLEEKQKSIEDIFAGRPYNVSESHGFVDTEELEALQLRKEIHLSDVYQVMFGVAGIKNVRDLAWRKNCGSKPEISRDWQWKIPENHVSDFLPSCSVFKFSRKGVPVNLDTAELSELLSAGYDHYGKVSYKMPSPYLDAAIPKGSY